MESGGNVVLVVAGILSALNALVLVACIGCLQAVIKIYSEVVKLDRISRIGKL